MKSVQKEPVSVKDHFLMRDNTSPLGVFLVKSGSKGDRLLFRYPYEMNSTVPKSDSVLDEVKPQAIKGSKRSLNPSNPYSSAQVEDFISASAKKPTSELKNAQQINLGLQNNAMSSEYHDGASNCSAGQGQYSGPYIATVVSLSDKVLSDLFAVKSTLCGQKFEVKINDIRFVGHPISLSSSNSSTTGDSEKMLKERGKDVLTFNVVFAVRANASHDIVNCYHECSQRIAISLQFEEDRTGYLSAETTHMIALHEAQTNDEGEEMPAFKEILESSLLAANLKKVFEDLTNHGTVHLSINNWINVSFCLPQKVHMLTLRQHDRVLPIGPQNIQACFEHLRPYHGVLLLVNGDTLRDVLPEDASPAFFRIINVVTPTKNLLELSADSDVALPQVFHVVAQLVYWGKATVIYPLCESNVYTVHPLTSSRVNTELALEFAKTFNESLLQLLSEFSLGATVSQVKPPTQTQPNLVSQIIWLLKHRLLLQLHCYVYLVPTNRSPPYLSLNNAPTRPTSAEPTSSASDADQYSSKRPLSPLSSTRAYGARIISEELSQLAKKKPLQKSMDESVISLLSGLHLSDAECENIWQASSHNVDDVKIFARLCPYFNGKRHLEDIMYYENVRRSQLLALIDKFRDVLLLCQYEDTAVAELCPYSTSSQ